MALHSLRVFRDFDDHVGGDSGFTETGFLALTPAEDMHGLRENLALQREVGIQTELLDREGLLQIMPGLEASDLEGAAFEPAAGYADPHLALRGYADALRLEGGVIRQETAVTGIRMAGGKAQGVDSNLGSYDGSAVINCAGPWGAAVGAMSGLGLPINSCRVQVGFFKRPEGHRASHPVIADFVNGVYWRDETGAQTLIGLIDPHESQAVVAPDEFNERVDMGFLAEAGERLVRRFPAMEQSQAAGGYAALYAITPDWHPIIDEWPPDSGLYICAGFSGHGFKLAPAVGEMIADMVLGGHTLGIAPDMFRFNRFAEHDPVRGRYEYSIVG
jgi:glycine/D-amino acid oxidase-like deaminating enzyme